jgi:hypothetical protein
MAESLIRSTTCRVLIEMPDGAHLWLTPEGLVTGLLHMHCHNDIGEGCGTFTLTFAPGVSRTGRLMDQLIPINSLVRIFCQDLRHPVTEQESCVMIGRTERHRLQIDRSQARPVRIITISGRSIASLLLDAHLWYHPGIERQGGTAGILTEGEHNFRLYWLSTVVEPDKDPRENIAKILTYFLGLPSRTTTGAGPASTSLADQEAAEQLRAVNPTLTHEQALTRSITARQQTATPPAPLMRGGMALEQLMEDDPTLIPAAVQARIARRRQQQGLQGPAPAPVPRPAPTPPPATPTPPPAPTPPTPPVLIPGGNPLINLRLPKTTVADILDLNNDRWSLFEDDVRVPITANTALAGSLWNYVHLFVDRLFQEFFTRIEDGVCAIHFRPKPFLQTAVTTGTRFRSNDQMRQTLPTVEVDLDEPGQLIALDVARDTTNVYNAFRIMPLQANPFLKEPSFIYQTIPTILTDPRDPSYVRNYGLRDMPHLSPYLSGMPTIPSTPENQKYEWVVETCKRWGQIAAAWYGVAPELYAGLLTVQGSPRYNCGIRLLTRDDRGEREFYVEGVDHTFDFRTGRYVTTMRVTRGWYLDGPTDDRRPPHTEPVT